METEKLSKLLKSLRDMDVTKKYENDLLICDQQRKNADEKASEAIYEELNKLAEKISEENKLERNS
ncbi:MAG: hypothetical protein K6B43_10315 [Treponema sp.]|nr:hypothetical protein [Treponema sp.]